MADMMADLLCPVLGVNLSVPYSVKLTALAATLCVVKVVLFPDLYADTKISTLFINITGVVIALWSFWKVFIFPSWTSPLRHLPKPPVRL